MTFLIYNTVPKSSVSFEAMIPLLVRNKPSAQIQSLWLFESKAAELVEIITVWYCTLPSTGLSLCMAPRTLMVRGSALSSVISH